MIIIGDSLLYNHLHLYFSHFLTCEARSIQATQFFIAAIWIILMPTSIISDDSLNMSANKIPSKTSIIIEGLAHDIRNLLNLILSLMSQNIFEKNAYDQVRALKNQFEYCQTLIEQLLSASLNKNLAETTEKLDLRKTIENIHFMLKPNISSKSLRSAFIVENKTPRFVLIKKRELIPIIVNLLTNSLKFTDNGFINMRLYWKSIDEVEFKESQPDLAEDISIQDHDAHANNVRIFGYSLLKSIHEPANLIDFHPNPDSDSRSCAGKLVILISDSGSGIPVDKMKDLFKKNFQFHNDKNIRKLGSGIGLWYSKWLIDKLDGKIEFSSKENFGTIIRLEFPCNRIRDSGYLSNSFILKIRSFPRKSNDHNQNTKSDKVKVLFVDDDKFILDGLKRFFLKKGIEIMVALSGEEAIRIYNIYNSISIIFLDIQLRDMDGFQTCKILKSIISRKCSIFGITGYSEESIINQANLAGMEKIFTKPVNPEILHFAIQANLKSEQSDQMV